MSLIQYVELAKLNRFNHHARSSYSVPQRTPRINSECIWEIGQASVTFCPFTAPRLLNTPRETHRGHGTARCAYGLREGRATRRKPWQVSKLAATLVPLLSKENLEPRLLEMVVRREGVGDAVFLHDDKGDAVSQ